MLKVILFVLGVSALTIVSARTNCRHNSECGAGECCYYHEGPLLLSRKRAAVDQPLQLQPVAPEHQGGYCEAYKLENESCSVFGKMNGHCECNPGLTCKFLSATDQKRAIYPGYGSYMCVKSQ